MSFWYLGSPYSKYETGLDAAHEAVCRNAGRLIRAGIPVFSPIAHTHPIAIACGLDPLSHDIWLPADRPLMEAACGIIVLTLYGWLHSKGLAHEIEYFKAAGKPIVWMEPGIVPELPEASPLVAPAPYPAPLPTDRAIRNSPPACPDLDQSEPDADEIAAKQRQQAKMARQACGDDASAILDYASMIVSGNRAAQHGPKERNHQNIADHWNAYLAGRLDQPISALDVALMMVELKVARTKLGAGRVNRDNYVDMAGYAGCAGEIALASDASHYHGNKHG